MTKMLYKGYLITREDGTKKYYLGWTIEEIRRLEVLRHNNDKPFTAVRLYLIEDVPHIDYMFKITDKAKRKLIVHNHELDEWLEIEGDRYVAGYIWNQIVDGEEEKRAAYKAMGIEIFKTFDTFRAYAFLSNIFNFQNEVDCVREVEHSLAMDRYAEGENYDQI